MFTIAERSSLLKGNLILLEKRFLGFSPGTNTLAYSVVASVTETILMLLTPRANYIKLFTAVVYIFS